MYISIARYVYSNTNICISYIDAYIDVYTCMEYGEAYMFKRLGINIFHGELNVEWAD